ncbi:hypothetical protein [Pulveribacter sp.]|uniref:hypothetical protein n=1 Tax=Pulveribacter sp. TaxID=2678893 RepID=UPI0028AE0904|nr:hypothetical protein [Pulveribacter sp.]
MKLFSFPAAALEKAIHKRILTLPSPHREWFIERWQQKPYKKSFVENKAMPLVTLVAKGKTWDDETFAQGLAEWDVAFYDAEAEVLRPLVEGDGLIQLMQKNLPAERAQALLARLEVRRPSGTPAATD